MLVDPKGKGNLHISHQDKEKCRLFSALTFPHKRLHHWEELGWCRSGTVSAILYHSEHCRLTTLSRKTSLHSLREKNGEGRKKRKEACTDCLLCASHLPGVVGWVPRDWRGPSPAAPSWGNSGADLVSTPQSTLLIQEGCRESALQGNDEPLEELINLSLKHLKIQSIRRKSQHLNFY